MASKLFPAGDPRAALIYANAMAPLSEIPGDVYEGIMQSREQTRLEEARRDQERARREDRRKTKRTEFLEAVAAAEGPSMAAQTPAATAGRGGAAPSSAAGPMYRTTVDPNTGMEVVSGMDFSPGSGFSPEDITLAMVRPSREDVVGRLEERRRAGHSLEDLMRLNERSQGAAPTIQERAEEIVRGYGLTSQQAAEIAGREFLGEETPFFDKLVAKKADDEGFVSPEAKKRVRRVQPEGERRPDEDIASASGQGLYVDPRTPEQQRNPFQRAMDAPEQPYGDPSLTPMASAYRESSQVMSAMLEGDYLGDQTPERTMQARAYERFVAEFGDEEGAEDLKRIRKIAWAQRARAKKKFMAAMMPNLKKVGIPNPGQVADLYFENPEQGKAVYGEAATAYRQVLANHPRVREEDEKRRQSENLGKAEEDGINLRATQYLDDSHANISGLIQERSKETHEDSLELEKEASAIISRQRVKPPAGRTTAQKMKFLRDDRSGAVSDEDKVTLRDLDDRMKNLKARENHLNIDNALLVAETAALKRGETPKNIEVSVGGKKYTKRALSAGGLLSFDLDGVENQNAATVYGGNQYRRSTETAEVRGRATASRAYVDPGSATPTTRPPTPPKTTRPTGADVNSLARLLTAHGYSPGDAKESAASASANPEFFWSQMDTLRKKKKDGGEEVPPGFTGDEKEVRDEDIYPDGWKAKAYDAGYRLVDPESDGPWANEKVLGKGNTATRTQLENKFGQD